MLFFSGASGIAPDLKNHENEFVDTSMGGDWENKSHWSNMLLSPTWESPCCRFFNDSTVAANTINDFLTCFI